MKLTYIAFFAVIFLSKIIFAQQYANNFDGPGSVPTGTWTLSGGTQVSIASNVQSSNSIPNGGSSSGGNNLLLADCGTITNANSVNVSGINMSGKSNIKIGFDIRKTNAYNISTPLDFSVDGVNWVSITDLNSTTGNSTWAFQQYSLPPSANNQANLQFRITFNSAVRSCTAPPNIRIDDFIVFYGGSPFPIKLSQFSAQILNKFKVQVNWQTSSEANFSHFEIQRSSDAVGFETIGKENGLANSNDLNSYSFIDEKPFQGLSYYRLKQVDIDGSEEVSKIISINFNLDEGLVFYPNPSTGMIQLSGVNLSNIEKINVMDVSGRILGSFNLNQNSLDVSALAPQVMIIETRLRDGNKYLRRVIKQ